MFIMKVFRPVSISDLKLKEKNINWKQNVLFFYLEHQVNPGEKFSKNIDFIGQYTVHYYVSSKYINGLVPDRHEVIASQS